MWKGGLWISIKHKRTKPSARRWALQKTAEELYTDQYYETNQEPGGKELGYPTDWAHKSFRWPSTANCSANGRKLVATMNGGLNALRVVTGGRSIIGRRVIQIDGAAALLPLLATPSPTMVSIKVDRSVILLRTWTPGKSSWRSSRVYSVDMKQLRVQQSLRRLLCVCVYDEWWMIIIY